MKFLFFALLSFTSFQIFAAVGDESTESFKMLANAVPGWPDIGDNWRGADIKEVTGNSSSLKVVYSSGGKNCFVVVKLVDKKKAPRGMGAPVSQLYVPKTVQNTCK